MGRFGVIFQNSQISKNGGYVGRIFKNPLGEFRRASMALGQSIMAKKFFEVLRAIAKTNFPEILFPPPGGESISGKIRKTRPEQISELVFDCPGLVLYR